MELVTGLCALGHICEKVENNPSLSLYFRISDNILEDVAFIQRYSMRTSKFVPYNIQRTSSDSEVIYHFKKLILCYSLIITETKKFLQFRLEGFG